jgi:RNA polymerase sigma-70 factor (ECF subfamily)
MFGYSTTENAQDMSDEEILSRSKAEPWLFAILLERYEAAFLRKAKSIIWNELDAEEIVQDAFTKIYVNAGKFEVREGAKFSSWAYTILINTALTRYQKNVKLGKRTVVLEPEMMEAFGEMKNHGAFELDRDLIERVLEKMPGHFTQVLRLHYLEHWSHKDIADETGESVGAVKSRIHRAKAEFRETMKELEENVTPLA